MPRTVKNEVREVERGHLYRRLRPLSAVFLCLASCVLTFFVTKGHYERPPTAQTAQTQPLPSVPPPAPELSSATESQPCTQPAEEVQALNKPAEDTGEDAAEDINLEADDSTEQEPAAATFRLQPEPTPQTRGLSTYTPPAPLASLSVRAPDDATTDEDAASATTRPRIAPPSYGTQPMLPAATTSRAPDAYSTSPSPAAQPFNGDSTPNSASLSTPPVAENGSYYGEISPATGRPKTVHVDSYYRKDGTYVREHYRSPPRRKP
jgi:hypothetical protein